jgi:Ricin-type beta-trefoil lectin domain-like
MTAIQARPPRAKNQVKSQQVMKLTARTIQEESRFTKSLLVPDPGIYTIQQVSNNRFLDAHEVKGKDFAAVTRIAQNNNTQRWELTRAGDDTYTIRQLSSGRFVDAHEIVSRDFALVTRPKQDNDTQRWIIKPSGVSTFTIQQKSNLRFVDAHEIKSKDFSVVTRPKQNNNTQRWIIKSASPPPDLLAHSFRIRRNGSTCSIAGIVRNIGNTSARGPFTIAIAVSYKSVSRSIETFVPVGLAIPPQAEFETNAIDNVPIHIRDSPDDIYRLDMLIDINFELFETTRSNNSVTINHWFSS